MTAPLLQLEDLVAQESARLEAERQSLLEAARRLRAKHSGRASPLASPAASTFAREVTSSPNSVSGCGTSFRGEHSGARQRPRNFAGRLGSPTGSQRLERTPTLGSRGRHTLGGLSAVSTANLLEGQAAVYPKGSFGLLESQSVGQLTPAASTPGSPRAGPKLSPKPSPRASPWTSPRQRNVATPDRVSACSSRQASASVRQLRAQTPMSENVYNARHLSHSSTTSDLNLRAAISAATGSAPLTKCTPRTLLRKQQAASVAGLPSLSSAASVNLCSPGVSTGCSTSSWTLECGSEGLSARSTTVEESSSPGLLDDCAMESRSDQPTTRSSRREAKEEEDVSSCCGLLRLLKDVSDRLSGRRAFLGKVLARVPEGERGRQESKEPSTTPPPALIVRALTADSEELGGGEERRERSKTIETLVTALDEVVSPRATAHSGDWKSNGLKLLMAAEALNGEEGAELRLQAGARVRHLFLDSMPAGSVDVLDITPVASEPLLRRFLAAAVNGDRCRVEVTFHGTRVEYVASILEVGLQGDNCSTAAYGRGAYVAAHAGTAHQYADPDENGIRKMLVVLAAVGDDVVKGEDGKQAMTTAVDRLQNPTQFCFVDDTRLLISHVVTYRVLDTSAPQRVGGGFKDPFQRELSLATSRAGRRCVEVAASPRIDTGLDRASRCPSPRTS
eukprot:TRINITY_DN49370_c0_g1_i1.p1 TRINITY_DN49370_c0_g1~~TRINITY_DN49370_c0_g1_i1.p1  ORF type:complete len:677 (+),score=110.21 TRINITY_DN49370_c0_g1_i1:89-2119(+)